MTFYCETILRISEHLVAARRLTYRERLQLERAIYRLASLHTMRELGLPLASLTADGHDGLLLRCEAIGIERSDSRLTLLHRAFAIMRLVAGMANVDPYLLNENISRIIHRYSGDLATLPSLLSDFAAAAQMGLAAGASARVS